MILDIPVQLTVELGRTKIAIRNLLQLAQGSVVELDRLAGEPMDVLVNGCLIAQGEVVVVNDKFGIRLTDVIAPDERLRTQCDESVCGLLARLAMALCSAACACRMRPRQPAAGRLSRLVSLLQVCLGTRVVLAADRRCCLAAAALRATSGRRVDCLQRGGRRHGRPSGAGRVSRSATTWLAGGRGPRQRQCPACPMPQRRNAPAAAIRARRLCGNPHAR